jgi:hypothetical protein
MRKKTPLQYTLALALLIAPPLALAFIDQESELGKGKGTAKNFDPQAPISPDGRTITLAGAIAPCAAGEKTAEVQATITQATTYASAKATTISPAQQFSQCAL